MKKIINYIDTMIEESINITINKYDIEGTEDCIKRVYNNHPKTKEYVLRIFNKMIKKSLTN